MTTLHPSDAVTYGVARRGNYVSELNTHILLTSYFSCLVWTSLTQLSGQRNKGLTWLNLARFKLNIEEIIYSHGCIFFLII